VAWAAYPWISRLSPTALLFVSLIEFVVLLVLLLARGFRWFGIDQLPGLIGGVLPLIVPWTGALGGVTISLVGIAGYWSRWGPNVTRSERAVGGSLHQREHFNAWHLTRPWIGAVFGSMAALIVVLVTRTVGLTSTGAVDVSPTGAATLAIISFVVGYRERTFRELVERVVDTILGPGSTTDAVVAFELSPATVEFPPVAVNNVSTQSVTLRNVGQSAMPSASLAVQGNAFSVQTTRLGNVAAGASEDIAVRFNPTTSGPATGSLSVTVDGTTKTVSLRGSTLP
jgi:hypothetical protein